MLATVSSRWGRGSTAGPGTPVCAPPPKARRPGLSPWITCFCRVRKHAKAAQVLALPCSAVMGTGSLPSPRPDDRVQTGGPRCVRGLPHLHSPLGDCLPSPGRERSVSRAPGSTSVSAHLRRRAQWGTRRGLPTAQHEAGTPRSADGPPPLLGACPRMYGSLQRQVSLNREGAQCPAAAARVAVTAPWGPAVLQGRGAFRRGQRGGEAAGATLLLREAPTGTSAHVGGFASPQMFQDAQASGWSLPWVWVTGSATW